MHYGLEPLLELEPGLGLGKKPSRFLMKVVSDDTDRVSHTLYIQRGDPSCIRRERLRDRFKNASPASEGSGFSDGLLLAVRGLSA